MIDAAERSAMRETLKRGYHPPHEEVLALLNELEAARALLLEADTELTNMRGYVKSYSHTFLERLDDFRARIAKHLGD